MDPDKRDLEKALEDPQVEDGTMSPDEPIEQESIERGSSQTDSGSTSASLDEKSEKLGGAGSRPEAYRTTTTTSTLSAVTTNSQRETVKKAKPWYKKMNPLRWGAEPEVPKEREVSREYRAGFFSKLTFAWVGPLMRVGYRRPLELNDIWLVNPDRSIDVLAEKMHANFNKRISEGKSRPLLRAMIDTFRFEFFLGGLLSLTSSCLMVVTPFILRYLIQFAVEAYAAGHGGPPVAIGRGLGLVFGVTLMQMTQSMCTNHYIYRGFLVGGEARGVLITLVFEKAMKISGRAKAGGAAIEDSGSDMEKAEKTEQAKKNFIKKMLNSKPKAEAPGQEGVAGDGQGWSNGRIVNLMSTDTYRVDQAYGLGHLIWTSPIAIVITLVLLLINLTYSALAGFGLLVIGMPLLTKAIKSLFARRKRINMVTDQRVSLTQEILSSVRFVKYFGWEESFLNRLNEIRKREIRSIQVLLAIRNAINAVSMALPIFASMLSFITYSLSNHSLDPAPIFSSLALFNSLRMPLNLLPFVIGQVTDGLVSASRIESFLRAEEQHDQVHWDLDGDKGIVLEDADFTWERTTSKSSSEQDGEKQVKSGKKEDKKQKRISQGTADSDPEIPKEKPENMQPFQLKDINVSVGKHELIAVIGTVGSGKSSLLAALAGDMRQTKGKLTLGATRSFCPQYAWIQNTTVKENVLFGKPMDKAWYEQVIDACALRADLDMLPAGDLTEIGERGITVSGGQKQRLNIARAIYYNADLVLMDDPLSAVDAHVGRHIFDKAIRGLLQDKCRILATHQLHVLSRCDKVVMLDEGRITAFDTFDNLMADNEDFQALMASTAQEEKEEEKQAEQQIDNGDTKERRKKAKKGAALMQQEERAVKSVSWSVYGAYIRASGSMFNAPIVITILILSQGANIVTSLWLSYWTSNKFGYSTGTYIGVYASLGFVQAMLNFIFSVTLSIYGTRSSRILLGEAMRRVLRAPMSFFDTTPLGRITNRFAKDVDTMDNTLSDAMRMYFFTLAMISAVFILIIAYFYYFAIALVPLFTLFLFSTSYYRASARELKRHEAVLRSHVFARFGEGVNGTASIRAYGLEDHFTRKLRETVDGMNSAYYLTFSNQRWVSLRLDTIGNLLVFVTGILVITSRFNVNPSISGLVLSYILSIVQMIQFSVRQMAEVENAMNATERIHYYGTQLDEEAPEHALEVPQSWPEKGAIEFNNVQMRYRDGLPLVLQGLDMQVAGGERIGVVGRTGAGKSSIMSALFRLVELSGGEIRIDGVNIAEVGLHDLRTRLAIIPQDPTLFKGTIRSNLDPFNEHTDLELWSALRQADLVSEDAGSEKADPTARIHLDGIVEEEGLNYSLGQRQLMALARALVRGAQIIVCDEATSSVDMETDQKIQRTIATAFRGKTLLCIAHRLKTIIGYDRICVMDQGQIAELDSPVALWEKGGIFRGMCERSGIRREDFDEVRRGQMEG
ncbi:MAG: hypothetical protein MMC23_008537 [Stictis urceolatum]|nr:hypothetical protein [Stictis urceolata]